jgi:hypothetical protein
MGASHPTIWELACFVQVALDSGVLLLPVWVFRSWGFRIWFRSTAFKQHKNQQDSEQHKQDKPSRTAAFFWSLATGYELVAAEPALAGFRLAEMLDSGAQKIV